MNPLIVETECRLQFFCRNLVCNSIGFELCLLAKAKAKERRLIELCCCIASMALELLNLTAILHVLYA